MTVVCQWSPNSRLLLFGTSAGEVLMHDSAGELIVSAVCFFKGDMQRYITKFIKSSF